MTEFVNSLKDRYDYIFIDTPPIGVVTDAGIVSTYSDGCIFVVGAKESEIETVKISIERLESLGANILGGILNKLEVNKGSSDYYSDYYKKRRRFMKKGKKDKRKREE